MSDTQSINEYIVLEDERIPAINVHPKINGIELSIQGAGLNLETTKNKFKNITNLAIASSADANPYGYYENLVFSSISIDTENTITITYSITPDIEVRMKQIETRQEETEAILAEALYGGNE